MHFFSYKYTYSVCMYEYIYKYIYIYSVYIYIYLNACLNICKMNMNTFVNDQNLGSKIIPIFGFSKILSSITLITVTCAFSVQDRVSGCTDRQREGCWILYLFICVQGD